MTKFPTLKSVRIARLVSDYGATFFHDALTQFIVRFNNPTFSSAQVEAESASIALPFNAVPVFHKIKYTTEDPYTADGPTDSEVDAIHVQPGKQLKNGNDLPARFDTALINDGTAKLPALTVGYRVAQIRVVFSFKPKQIQTLFSTGRSPPSHLAYVEWFSPFSPQPEPHHLMYKINRSLKNGDRIASIIPVANIRRSVHLIPKFGPVAPPEWTSSNVLDRSTFFFANSLSDRHIYTTLF
ncbi:hypothetical protein B0H10DRAFT_1822795 [Mycena sp. CBHHK59/15]|nr:hypothetical protein B0H10DRAFT_1822795 [Mycena sp. CBHHK59/15]